MITNLITTNLRIPKDDLSLTRAMALGVGMSINEYMNVAIKKATYADYVAVPQKKKVSVYDALIKLSKMKVKDSDRSEFSEDDEAIYGH
jgi:hypothetical protein